MDASTSLNWRYSRLVLSEKSPWERSDQLSSSQQEQHTFCIEFSHLFSATMLHQCSSRIHVFKQDTDDMNATILRETIPVQAEDLAYIRHTTEEEVEEKIFYISANELRHQSAIVGRKAKQN